MFRVLKRTVSLRRFFEYPQHMFWFQEKENKVFVTHLTKYKYKDQTVLLSLTNDYQPMN